MCRQALTTFPVSEADVPMYISVSATNQDEVDSEALLRLLRTPTLLENANKAGKCSEKPLCKTHTLDRDRYSCLNKLNEC